MILKKPYAFFIKFFKFFHLVIFLLASVLLYRTSLIYNFMKEYCASSPNVIGKDLISPLFVYWLYILIVIILVVNVLLIFILVRKTKPYMYYVINIALYVAVLVVFIISHNVISNMQVMLVAPRTTLAIRDFLNLARLFQTVSVIFYLVRATGFDIKKFDFVRDLQSLDISEEDSEEIEVAVQFEGNVILRNLKRRFREFKYYYKENKFILNIVFLIFLSIVFLLIYFSFNKYDKVYKENEFFNVSNYNIGILNSNIITKDYRGNSIVDDDSVLVAVLVSANSKFSSSISTSRVVLVVNGMQYYHTKSYASSLTDLGNVYNDQSIGNDFTDYLFVYKIPKEALSYDIIFRYVDNIEYKRGKTIINSIDVKLNPNYLDSTSISSFEYALGNEIFINDYRVLLNSYDVSDMFVNSYNSCITGSECYDFREVLKASSTRNRDKVLLKVNGSVGYVDDLGSSINLYDFISKFGSVEYVYNGSSYIMSDFNLVTASRTSEKNIYYIEVDKEIMDASDIKFVFNFRTTKYSYVLRGDISE